MPIGVYERKPYHKNSGQAKTLKGTIEAARSAGRSYQSIADELGLANSTVRRVLIGDWGNGSRRTSRSRIL